MSWHGHRRWFQKISGALHVQVGLGTDVAGGYSPSMLHAMRSCVITSRALRMQRLATMGLQNPQTAPAASQNPQAAPTSAQNSEAVATSVRAGSSGAASGHEPLPVQPQHEVGDLHAAGATCSDAPAQHAGSSGTALGTGSSCPVDDENMQSAGRHHEEIVIVPAAQRRQLEGCLLDWKAAFWLGTQGGAEALGIQDRCGSLQIGKSFDALRIDTRSSTFDVFPMDQAMDAFQKFINLGDDRNIKAVWVMGEQVHSAAPP